MGSPYKKAEKSMGLPGVISPLISGVKTLLVSGDGALFVPSHLGSYQQLLPVDECHFFFRLRSSLTTMFLVCT